MKILILGGGYTGTHLESSLKQDHDVTILRKAELNYNAGTDAFTSYLREHEYDYVINCSGFTGRPNVDQCEDEKPSCWDLNVTGPFRVNQSCRELSIPYIHISSGCIYTGYDKEYVEDDEPNFGMWSKQSSFYSKTKHAYEILCKDYGLTIRIRMPFDDDIESTRSVLHKLRKYDNLVDFVNSKTYLPDLCDFILLYINEGYTESDVINFVNPDALSTKDVADIMSKAGEGNSNWKFVDFDSLGTKANRSNCVLNIDKLKTKYNFTPKTEREALNLALF